FQPKRIADLAEFFLFEAPGIRIKKVSEALLQIDGKRFEDLVVRRYRTPFEKTVIASIIDGQILYSQNQGSSFANYMVLRRDQYIAEKLKQYEVNRLENLGHVLVAH